MIKEYNKTRDSFPSLFYEYGYRRGAEIGVYKGEYTKKFLDAGIKMYAVDPWKAFNGQGRSQNRQDRQDFLYGHTCRYLNSYVKSGLCSIIREASMNALRFFRDKSLDFVYIDGDHSFGAVASDIYYWSQKVKDGGIVAGHDYFQTGTDRSNVICHVKSVVDAYVEAFKIDELWITKCSGIRPDIWPSWFWIKR